MRHMLGNLSPNYFERTKRYMMLRASQQGTDLTVSGTPPLSLPNSLGKPLKAWSVDLLPYQEGSGDPAPDNVRPIHGTDKLMVWTGSQNLFQTTAESKTENGVTWTVNTDGSVSVSGIATDYTDLLLGESAIDYHWGTVTISGIASATNIAWASIKLLDDNDTVVYTISPGGYAMSFTVDLSQYPTATKIRIVLKRNNNREVSGVVMPMVNLGSTVLPFVPYLAPSQTVLTLPQTVYAGTIGSDGGESRWGEVDLGDLAWEYIGTSNKYFQTNSIKNIVKAPVTVSTVADAMCEAYKMVSWSTTTYTTGLMAIAGANNPEPGRLSCINTNYTDVDSFAAAMQGIKLVFELKTATTFAVTSPPIPTPTGTATTWATAEDGTVDGMEVTYVGKA